MAELAPLTPADSDLQDFPFMPLQVARLRDSDLAAVAPPESCWYAVLLWAASWHQLPAGSLPNDDLVLTKLIGLGRDVKTFRKHKSNALRGFVECSDGRLYHPVVAEQVSEAWESKKQQRWRTECARIKKHNQRHGTNLPTPTYEQFAGQAPPAVTSPSPPVVPEDTPESPSGQSLQETGTGTGILEERSDDLFVAISEVDIPKPVRRTYPPEFEAAWKAYPHHEGRSSKPSALAEWKKLPPDERAALPRCIALFVPMVETTCGGKGAPCMGRWLKAGKHLNWLEAATKPVIPAGPPEDPWRKRLRMFVRDKSWSELDWGPRPGRPGCTVDPAILREFGIEPARPQPVPEQAA